MESVLRMSRSSVPEISSERPSSIHRLLLPVTSMYRGGRLPRQEPWKDRMESRGVSCLHRASPMEPAMTRPAILRAITLAAASVVLSTAALSQATVSVRGRVVDGDGHPLESVEVSASMVGRVARTDSVGRFTITGLLAGRNRLLVRRLGFKAVDTTFIIDPDRKRVV